MRSCLGSAGFANQEVALNARRGVAIIGTLAGTTNALGWSTVLIYLFGAVGSGYFLIAQSQRPAQL
jgi:hypothetical protein